MQEGQYLTSVLMPFYMLFIFFVRKELWLCVSNTMMGFYCKTSWSKNLTLSIILILIDSFMVFNIDTCTLSKC